MIGSILMEEVTKEIIQVRATLKFLKQFAEIVQEGIAVEATEEEENGVHSTIKLLELHLESLIDIAQHSEKDGDENDSASK